MKKRSIPFFVILILASSLAACNTAASTPSPSIQTPSTTLPSTQAPATQLQPTQPEATAISQEVPLAEAFPLSGNGPYFVGTRVHTIVDASRNNREIDLVIHYPAIEKKNENGQSIKRDAEPDLSDAPYPLVLTESDTGGMLISSQLASHGFVMVSISIPDHNDFFNWDINMISWPMDFLVTLDQLSLNPVPELMEVYDVVRVGVTGYSYGGDISLALSGARIDPQDYLDYCKNPPLLEVGYGPEWYQENACGPSKKWGEMEAFAGEDYTSSPDGLWRPLTDPRIVAVMPMAPSGAWLYGERGLAAADRPVLLLANTEDEFSPYLVETAFIYENLGGPEVSLITFVGRDHMMAFDANEVLRIKHFMVAFFGYHLQGRQDYHQYFSEEFISQFEDLAWGIYK